MMEGRGYTTSLWLCVGAPFIGASEHGIGMHCRALIEYVLY